MKFYGDASFPLTKLIGQISAASETDGKTYDEMTFKWNFWAAVRNGFIIEN